MLTPQVAAYLAVPQCLLLYFEKYASTVLAFECHGIVVGKQNLYTQNLNHVRCRVISVPGRTKIIGRWPEYSS